jgi:hypothetical protein
MWVRVHILYLASLNVSTGVVDKVHDFIGGGNFTAKILFNNAGDAFALSADGPGSDWSLYDLNLENGELSNPRVVGGASDCPLGLASNHVDDTFYAFCYDGRAFTVNKATGVTTADHSHDLVMEDYLCPGTSETRSPFPGDFAFDANGDLWVASNGCNVELLFYEFASGYQTFQGQLHEATPSLYSNAPNYDIATSGIFITTGGGGSSGVGSGSEELAATGMNSGANALAVLALATVVGAAAIRRRPRV